MRKTILSLVVFVWFGLIIYLAFEPSLKLSLYGDDWYVIGKYFYNFGPHGASGGYFDKQLYTTNYGPQFVAMAILWAIFKDYAFPYFLASLLLRLLLTFGIYWFVKILINKKIGIMAGSIFAVIAAGSETTDWVYNMNSYLGIFLVIWGLGHVLTNSKIRGWVLMILGYITVIIRVYVLPFLLVFIVFANQLIKKRHFSLKYLPVALSALFPFLIIKLLFPGLGFQGIVGDQIKSGLSIAKTFIQDGRYDFLLYPFIYVGRMLIPYGLDELGNIGWGVVSVKRIIFYGAVEWAIGTAIIYCANNTNNFRSLVKSALISVFVLVMLAVFVKFQGKWMINTLAYFVWTYMGIIFSTAVFKKLTTAIKARNNKKIGFWAVSVFFIYSFLLTWAYGVQVIPIVHLRYLILSAVGVSMAISEILFSASFLRFFQIFSLVFILFVNIISTRNFFETHLAARNYKVSKELFSQLKSVVPSLPNGKTSVFYFENTPPLVFEELFRFGFGYHMQLFYGLDFDEKNFPYGVSSKGDLVRAVSDPNYPGRLLGNKTVTQINNVYAFILDRNKLIDITQPTRVWLENEVAVKNE